MQKCGKGAVGQPTMFHHQTSANASILEWEKGHQNNEDGYAGISIFYTQNLFLLLFGCGKCIIVFWHYTFKHKIFKYEIILNEYLYELSKPNLTTTWFSSTWLLLFTPPPQPTTALHPQEISNRKAYHPRNIPTQLYLWQILFFLTKILF